MVGFQKYDDSYGVSIHGDIPIMDGSIRENPVKMDDLGVPPF